MKGKQTWAVVVLTFVVCTIGLGVLYQSHAKATLPPHVRYHGCPYFYQDTPPLSYSDLENQLIAVGPVDVLVQGRAQRDFQTNETEFWGGGLYVAPGDESVLYLRLDADRPNDRLLLLQKGEP